MNTRMYNNPVFASNLAGVVDSVVGNPNDIAYQEQAIADARLANDTAGYRRAIGDFGHNQDLAGLLISSLQAGEEWSDNAPVIASSLASLPEFGYGRDIQGNIQVGTGTQKAKDTFSGLSMALAKSGGGGGGGRGGGGSTPRPPKGLSRGMTSYILSEGEAKGLTPEESQSLVVAVEDALNSGALTENAAMQQVLSGVEVTPEVVDTNDSWVKPWDWVRGPEVIQERSVKGLGQPTPPPPMAVEALRNDPSLAAQFDEKYGAGAADRILSGG